MILLILPSKKLSPLSNLKKSTVLCLYHFGFTTGEVTWLPINTSFLNGINVQEESQNESSPLSVYKKVVSIRKNHENLILWGCCEILTKKKIFVMKRTLAKTGILLMINFANEEVTINPEDFVENITKFDVLFHHSMLENSGNHNTIKSKGFAILLYHSS